MDIAIWIVQALLALAFGMAGFMKLSQPKAKLAERNLKWVEDFDANIVKLIGGLEVLAALGLILPWLTKILPILTPLAASGLVIIMLGAAFTHFRRKEYPLVGVNLVLLLLALFVVYGRFVLVPMV